MWHSPGSSVFTQGLVTVQIRSFEGRETKRRERTKRRENDDDDDDDDDDDWFDWFDFADDSHQLNSSTEVFNLEIK